MQAVAEQKSVEEKRVDLFRSALKLYFDNKKFLNCRLTDVKVNKTYKSIEAVFKVPAAYRLISTGVIGGPRNLYQGYFPAYTVAVHFSYYPSNWSYVALGNTFFYNSKGILSSFLPNHYNGGEFCIPEGHGSVMYTNADTLFKGMMKLTTVIWDSHFNNDAMPYIDPKLVKWFRTVLGADLTSDPSYGVCGCSECTGGTSQGDHYGTPQLLEAICKGGKLDWNSAPIIRSLPKTMKSLTLTEATKDLNEIFKGDKK